MTISKYDVMKFYEEQGKWIEKKWCTVLYGVAGEFFQRGNICAKTRKKREMKLVAR